MFHRPNLHVVPKLAESLDIDLIEIETEGVKEKELESLRDVLGEADISGIVAGAVASSYQMERIEDIAEELGLDIFAPLWKIEQEEILEKLISSRFQSVIVSVAALGLDETWLGREIDHECLEELKALKERYGINPAGEGGEYESLVIDAPNYRWGFEIVEEEKTWDGQRGTYRVERMRRKK